jgi:hypothetical protein
MHRAALANRDVHLMYRNVHRAKPKHWVVEAREAAEAEAYEAYRVATGKTGADQ